ncbi:uncharacterized protein LOC135107572 [Scylla paramamosain]|uniref:uncharacterized protein LOC135107572 n=1 Tax=Scylla paramamosain TaxID=85552 RepID=UPI003082F77E
MHVSVVMAAAVLAEVTVGSTELIHHQRASQCSRSRTIVTKANICLEYIDNMKDSFVRDTVGYTWETADSKYPIGEMQAPYLPQLPPTGTHTPGTFHEELVRQYGLLQNCLLAFEYLSLDQVLFPFVNPHVESVDKVDRQLNIFTGYLKTTLQDEGLQPDHILTAELGRVTYTEERTSVRMRRAFVILRDTRATLLHTVEVFQTYC